MEEGYEIAVEFEFQGQRYASILWISMDLERARLRKHYQIDPMIADRSFQGWKHKFTYEWELFFDDVLYSLNLEHVSDGVFNLDIMKAYNRKGTSTNKPECQQTRTKIPNEHAFTLLVSISPTNVVVKSLWMRA